MLYDDGAVRHERPEFIRSEFRISLQMIEKGVFVGIVVGKGLFDPQQFLPLRGRVGGVLVAATAGGGAVAARFPRGDASGGVEAGRRVDCVRGVEKRVGGGGADGHGAGRAHYPGI